MQSLSIHELLPLCRGAALLGSGGGGDPEILYAYLHFLLQKSQSIMIRKINELPNNALIVPIAFVGAPLISIERIPNKTMFIALGRQLRLYYPDRAIFLMPAEIGGCNALSPFVLAALDDFEVIDGDLIGRAFPKVSMCKPAVLGNSHQISFISNIKGEVIVIETFDIEELENRIRDYSIQFGSSILIATFLFDVNESDDYLIADSLSRAYQLGFQLVNNNIYQRIDSGIITQVCQRIENGFLIGHVQIKTLTQYLTITFQNEYLFVHDEGQSILSATPDIIALIDARSNLPLTSESLRYGLHVNIVSLPSPAFWNLPYANKYVDRSAFNQGKNLYV